MRREREEDRIRKRKKRIKKKREKRHEKESSFHLSDKKPWRGPILMRSRQGDQNTCGSCYDENKAPIYIVHDTYTPFRMPKDLSKDMTDAEKESVGRMFSKVASEIFLCKTCWDQLYYNNPAKYDESGQATFTSMPMKAWNKRPTTLWDEVFG